jgi:uncharacterized membrane protein YeaQ/YmgE (transglycosylase-associated protein family)
MNFIVWLIFGALAGWVASMITGRNERQGCIMNIVAGVIGAALGGWLMTFFVEGFQINEFSLINFAVAVGGAVLFLGVLNLLFGRR